MSITRQHRYLAIVLTWVGATLAAAADPSSARAEAVFKGNSTLHAFEGRAVTEQVRIAVPPQAVPSTGTWSASARFEVGVLNTANDSRDANMFRMFETNRFPLIEGRIEDCTLPAGADGEADLLLTIHGRTEHVHAELHEWVITDQEVSFSMRFPVVLSVYGLKAPSVLGMIRVADRIDVVCRVRAPRAATGGPRS